MLPSQLQKGVIVRSAPPCHSEPAAGSGGHPRLSGWPQQQRPALSLQKVTPTRRRAGKIGARARTGSWTAAGKGGPAQRPPRHAPRSQTAGSSKLSLARSSLSCRCFLFLLSSLSHPPLLSFFSFISCISNPSVFPFSLPSFLFFLSFLLSFSFLLFFFCSSLRPPPAAPRHTHTKTDTSSCALRPSPPRSLSPP